LCGGKADVSEVVPAKKVGVEMSTAVKKLETVTKRALRKQQSGNKDKGSDPRRHTGKNSKHALKCARYVKDHGVKPGHSWGSLNPSQVTHHVFFFASHTL
jgi:hypothetical protein